MDRITVQELYHLRETGVAVILIDARPSASRARDGVIPGAIAFEDLLLNNEQLRGGEAVVYCACPNEATAARVARKLINLGFRPVRPLAGGIHAWQDAGFQVVRP
jgi:rhodanese-related sulfurtransferase